MLIKPIKIGTRASPLALAQAYEVKSALVNTGYIAGDEIDIVKIITTGDKIKGKPLSEIGGKGLFTKEIEEKLLSGQIDLAVHSMKDMPTILPDRLSIECILPRENPRDGFISNKYLSFAELPVNAVIGTSSLRRQAQVKSLRPDITIVQYRGNVGTRISKLDNENVDATFLACAGLKRLNMFEQVTEVMDIEKMLPAVAQGAIGIEVRKDNTSIIELISLMNHPETAMCVAMEREFLKILDGSCRTPIAGYAEFISDNEIIFRGQILLPDGSKQAYINKKAEIGNALEVGAEAGQEIKGFNNGEVFNELVSNIKYLGPNNE